MPYPYRGLSGTINDEQARPLKGSQFLDAAEQKLGQGISYLKDASKDREGIGDDLLRLVGGGLKNVGHVANAPVIKQGLQLAGAIPWAAGQAIGAGLEHGLGIDPRYGHIAGELGDIAVGAGALKIGSKLARKGAKNVARYGDAFYGLASGTAMGTGAHGAGGTLKIAKGYNRADAIENLNKLGGQTSWGKTKRTIQGPVPPALLDKTFRKGAKTQEEAIMSGTTKFVKDGDPFQIRNYAAAYSPKGQTTKVATRKTTGRGITQEGNTRKLNEALATADWITPKETKAFGKAMAQAAAEGMDGDHIVEVARVANGVRNMTPARREAYFRIFENTGIHLGNHPKNIQKLSKELNQVVKPAEIRSLDNTLRNMDKRSKTLLEDMLFSGKKTSPTQFPEQIQKHIKRSQEIGIPEPTWKSGSIDYTWRPQSGTGQIDIPPQSLKTFKGLRDEFFNQIEDLPSGSVWELNPKFKDAKRRRIYGKLFEGDQRITRNADETLGWVLTIP